LSVFVTHLPPTIPAAYPREPGNGRLTKPGIIRCQGLKSHQKLDATPVFGNTAPQPTVYHRSEVRRSLSQTLSPYPTVRRRCRASTDSPSQPLNCNPAERHLRHQPVR